MKRFSMMTPFFSIIIPVKNRCDFRLENAVKSLCNQEIEPKYYEIILIDYGSDSANYSNICNKYGIRYIRTEGESFFHDARARNIGIKQSNGKYIVSTNSDILFPDSFLNELLYHLKSYTESFLLWKRYNVNAKNVPSKTYKDLLKIATPEDDSAQGDCQVFPKPWAEQVGGFDEDYVGWGWVDIDLTERAGQSGLNVRLIRNNTPLLHQNHPTCQEARHYDNLRNSAIFHYKHNQIKRNEMIEWGKISNSLDHRNGENPFDDYRNGLICEDKKDINLAIDHYMKAISKLPDFFECYLSIARIHLINADIHKTNSIIDIIYNPLKLRSNIYEYSMFSCFLFDKAIYHKLNNEFNEAICCFKMAIEFNSDKHFLANTYLLLGIMYNMIGEYLPAIDLFDNIISNFDGLYGTEANYHKAISLRGLKDFRQAWSVLDAMPSNHELHDLILDLKTRTANDLH